MQKTEIIDTAFRVRLPAVLTAHSEFLGQYGKVVRDAATAIRALGPLSVHTSPVADVMDGLRAELRQIEGWLMIERDDALNYAIDIGLGRVRTNDAAREHASARGILAAESVDSVRDVLRAAAYDYRHDLTGPLGRGCALDVARRLAA